MLTIYTGGNSVGKSTAMHSDLMKRIPEVHRVFGATRPHWLELQDATRALTLDLDESDTGVSKLIRCLGNPLKAYHANQDNRSINHWLGEITNVRDVYANIHRNGRVRLYPEQQHRGSAFKYAFPVIVAACVLRPQDFLVVENPELFLAPYNAFNMGSLLAHTAIRGVEVIIETVDGSIMEGIRSVVRADMLPERDVRVLFCDSTSIGRVNLFTYYAMEEDE